MSEDKVLNEMASEFRDALLVAGLDPNNPPKDKVPSDKAVNKAWQEYFRRGGNLFKTGDEFVSALLKRTSEISS